MNNKLGYTWYPKDWWTSKTWRQIKKKPRVRLAFRCLLDLLYDEGGEYAVDRNELQSEFLFYKTPLTQEEWNELRSYFLIEGDVWTHKAVSKRLSRAESSRTNGAKGGRPPKPRKPDSKPTLEKKVNKRKVNKEKGNDRSKHSPEVVLAFDKFMQWIDANAPRVNKMATKININNFVTLKKNFPDMTPVTEMLKEMENWKDLTKKKTSAYLTLVNWLKRETK